jgi:xylulokinase
VGQLLGIDIGTTGARAIVVDPASGRVVAEGTSEYPLHTPRPLWAEQDAGDWWRGAVAAVRMALGKARGTGPVDVTAIGLSGQMHGVVLVDAAGEPIGRSLIWCDGRTEQECADITSRLGAERLLELTANPALTGFSAPKLLWVRQHAPAEFERARKFLLPKDYVRLRLTGEYASEVSDASGTLLFDVVKRCWSDAMLEALQLDRSLLPPVHESPVVSARVSRAVAAELGLAPGTPVVGGGGDQAAGAVGAGIVRPGVVSSVIGSSGVVFAHATEPARDGLGRVHTFCHAVPGAWHVMGVTQGAGLSLRWFRDEVAGPLEKEDARRHGRDVYDVLTETAASVPAGSDGLCFLPYLMGERTPHLDPRARGVWFGITAAHTRAHLVRSILEGVAYSLKDCLDILTEMGVAVGEVRASGGGGRSPFWRQVQADVFGVAVASLGIAEGPAYGAALLAGVGTGAWSSVAEACEATVRVSSRLAPNPDTRAAYARGHAVYKDLYKRLAPLYKEVV